MGFRRSVAVLVMLAALAPVAVALSAPPKPKKPEPKPPTSTLIRQSGGRSAGSATEASKAIRQSAARTIAAGSSAGAPASSTPPNSSGAAGPASATSTSKAAEAALAQLEAAKTQPGDPKAGQTKAAACGACHGMDGNSSDAQYPKLADQSEQYIVTQLMRFKSGVRQNAIMQGMAAPLSPQDMHDLGAYFAEQKRLPGVADEKLASDGGKLYREGDPSRGIPACMACHGPDGAGNPGWRVPNIAGQHADYVQAQLKAWHDGASWGSDAHAQIMPSIAEHLTQQDISAVSSYVEGLHAAPAPKPATQPNTID